MPDPEPLTALGFDFGEKRIGVAVGQSVTGTARALATVRRTNQRPDWPTIERLVAEWQPDRFVVGLPRHADDSPHTLAAPIARFCRQLEGRFRRPAETVDERLTSREAEASGAADVDAEAARLILETWFTVYSQRS